jgi:hypothetical protein
LSRSTEPEPEPEIVTLIGPQPKTARKRYVFKKEGNICNTLKSSVLSVPSSEKIFFKNYSAKE